MNDNQQGRPESGTPLRYWAFISYSSKDVNLAKRLHIALETYPIARDLVGRPGRDSQPVSPKLFPIFRDRDELPLSSDLGGSIQDALRASRYLIILCTPDAAKSRWVNEEIRYFKSLGREDRLLALIARGEPNASEPPGREAEECFPEALRFRLDAHGNASWAARFGAYRNEIDKTWFGLDHKPATNAEAGAAQVTNRCDERGNKTETAYFGTQGGPVAPQGWAREVVRYDPVAGSLLETIHYDVHGAVVIKP